METKTEKELVEVYYKDLKEEDLVKIAYNDLWALRSGDLHAEPLNSFGYSSQYVGQLKELGLIFGSKEQAEAVREELLKVAKKSLTRRLWSKSTTYIYSSLVGIRKILENRNRLTDARLLEKEDLDKVKKLADSLQSTYNEILNLQERWKQENKD